MSHGESHHIHQHDDHGHHDNHGHDHGKPHGFLNTVFESSVGGFGILWVSILLISITLIMLLG